MRLVAQDISKNFGQKKIIKNISINVNINEIVSILGTSGIGKTTLFNILSGLYSPDFGNVFLNNQNITGIPGKVSYMFQRDLLFDFKTIIDNVSLPLIIKGTKKIHAHKIAKNLFEQFGLLDCEKKYPYQISGGMRQRAALLRTYLFSKDIFLLDEPFSSLDMFTKSKMHEWYLNISKKLNFSTIFITHDIDEAIILSDRIYIMSGIPATIIKEIKIKKNFKTIQKFLMHSTFLQYKYQILNEINF